MRFDRRKRSRYCKGTRLPGRRHLENTMRLTERKGALGTGWTGRRKTLGMRLTGRREILGMRSTGKGTGPQNLHNRSTCLGYPIPQFHNRRAEIFSVAVFLPFLLFCQIQFHRRQLLSPPLEAFVLASVHSHLQSP